MGLSSEQSYAFSLFRQGKNILISGSGGTGKSELIKVIVNDLHTNKKKNYQVTSTTGCSSVILSNNIDIHGKKLSVKTINSWAGIRLCKGSNEDIIDNVVYNKYLSKSWEQIQTLIIDEVSMMSCKMFTVLNSIAKRIRRNNQPFGGIQLILVGDFMQLPPIEDITDPETAKFCFEAEDWYHVIPLENHVELKTIFRQKDPIFRSILNEIRIGELSETNNKILQSYVGRKYNAEEHNGILPIQILSTRNEVSTVNKYQYSLVKGEEFIFSSTLLTNASKYIENEKVLSSEDKKKCTSLTPQRLKDEVQRFKNNLSVDEIIFLKIGVPVMILVNLDLEKSISNGTLGIVVRMIQHMPVVRFTNGSERLITPYTWQHTDYPTITLSQLPLTLSYASSIHKQQGASIELARMNLGNSVFEDSQIYVALSRLTSLHGLYLDAFHANKISVNSKAKEFYKQFIPILKEIENSFVEKSLFPTVVEENVSRFFNKNTEDTLSFLQTDVISSHSPSVSSPEISIFLQTKQEIKSNENATFQETKSDEILKETENAEEMTNKKMKHEKNIFARFAYTSIMKLN